MKNSITGIILVLALLGVGGLFFTIRKANTLKQNLISAESKTDSLRKEAEFLGKDVKIFQGKTDSLTSKNQELEKSFTETNSKLTATQQEVWKNQKAIEESAKKYNELLATQKDWEKQMANLKTANAQLGQENKSLTSKVVLLLDSNKLLNDQLASARLASKDNILIESMTKSGKLNIR
ncbi:MAG: hypothetical protein HY015_01080 [Bacteroidetes bacterium]|nr:hypothetical protein [Bacteroidota bacterium]MBI3481571.1 hypothetical protein [Bacteroidota bacterium]